MTALLFKQNRFESRDNRLRRGFKAQGRDVGSAYKIIKDAEILEKTGAFANLLEAVPPEVGKVISEKCRVTIMALEQACIAMVSY